MVLVETSVWIQHLNKGNAGLEKSLNDGEVMCHPFIIGELACGHLNNRAEILSLLQTLPMAVCAEHEEVMKFIEDFRLMGKGLGYVDICLLSSARLTGVPLWTFDKKLAHVSSKLGLSF